MKFSLMIIKTLIIILSSVAYSFAQTCQPVQPDLVSWWPGDGNSLDVRNRNDGTLQNGATYGTGKVGQGFSLDGVNDFVSTPDTPSLNFGTGAFSIETWVNFNSLSGEQILVEKYIETLNTNSTGVTFAKITSNRFLLAFTGGGTVVTGFQTLAINTWYHLAATRDEAGNVEIYLDGVSIASGTNSANVDSTSSVKLGHRGSPTNTPGSSDTRGFYLRGLIDETSIYGRGLSSAEVLAIFSADGNGKCKPTATVKPSGLVGWWAGDGNATDIENGADGTLLNGTGFIVGRVGQSFTFGNSNQYIEASDTNLPMGSNPRTTEMWIKPNNNARVTAIYGTQIATSAFYPIVISNNICIGQFSGGDQCGTTNIVDGNWHHIAITYDGASTTTLYLDGQVERVVSRSYNTATNGGLLRIGNTFSGSSDDFDGDMDEISIYNRSLTLTELKSIFDAGLAGKLKSVNTNAPAPPLSEFANKFKKTKGQTNVGSSVISEVGDATITFSSVSASGTTQQIPFDVNDMPALPSGIITGLEYDIATSASYTGDVGICFNLPAFTTSIEFAGLRVLHLENDVWENRTTTTDFATRTLCSTVASLSPFAIIKFPPTAANVTISGKVLTANGRAIPRATVSITDHDGIVRTITSNHFGNYSFENISAGEIYTFVINSKQYQFDSQVVNVSESITNLNFIAN